jgi:hypothetical protein
MNRYWTIKELLCWITSIKNKESCLKIHSDNEKLFQTVQGSTNNHQAWVGGYQDHVQEVMNIAYVLYESLSDIRRLPFYLSEALTVLFLHDIEKPWKYELKEDGRLYHLPEFETKAQAHAFRQKKLDEYGIILTPEQQNAMLYVEGEFGDYSNRERKMGPLAAFCHLCDVTSARIWFNHPMEKDDPWLGAKRVRD